MALRSTPTPVLIAWATEDEWPSLAGSVVGEAGPVSQTSPRSTPRFVTGQVVLDAADLARGAVHLAVLVERAGDVAPGAADRASLALGVADVGAGIAEDLCLAALGARGAARARGRRVCVGVAYVAARGALRGAAHAVDADGSLAPALVAAHWRLAALPSPAAACPPGSAGSGAGARPLRFIACATECHQRSQQEPRAQC